MSPIEQRHTSVDRLSPISRSRSQAASHSVGWIKDSRPQRQRATKQGRNVATNRWVNPSAAPEHFSSRRSGCGCKGRWTFCCGCNPAISQAGALTSSRSWPALTRPESREVRVPGFDGADGNGQTGTRWEEKPSDGRSEGGRIESTEV